MGSSVTCDFCWHLCKLKEGQRGLCQVRENQGGAVVTLGYGQVLASGMDPIEKKPMYHLLPGAKTLSFALFGCNLRCQFCQNHDISQPDSSYWPGAKASLESEVTSAKALVMLMQQYDSPIMSYTYSDPIVWQDYMLDVAKQVHRIGRLNCMVTNGSFSTPSLQRVLPFIDGFNIDVKGDEQFYRTYCGGSLDPVLDSVETIAAQSDKILEVTTLLIEGIHDAAMVRLLAQRLAQRQVQVWHLSRFFPHYRMQHRKPTSEAFLQEMLMIAKDSGIPYVYAGNSSLEGWDKTVCPSCHQTLISSHTYHSKAALEAKTHIVDGVCERCGEPIYGRFSS